MHIVKLPGQLNLANSAPLTVPNIILLWSKLTLLSIYYPSLKLEAIFIASAVRGFIG